MLAASPFALSIAKAVEIEMFDAMVDGIHQETVALLMHVNIEKAPVREERNIQMVAVGSNGVEKSGPAHAKKEPGRNDPCPCGSGRKYKVCCGKK